MKTWREPWQKAVFDRVVDARETLPLHVSVGTHHTDPSNASPGGKFATTAQSCPAR